MKAEVQTVQVKCAVCGESMQVDVRQAGARVSHFQCAFDACAEARKGHVPLDPRYVQKFMK